MLPRLGASLGSIVDTFGVATTVFSRFWDSFATAIETNEAALQDQETAQAALLAALQTQQDQLSNQLALINEALATAQNPPAGGSSSKTQTQAQALTVNGTSWVSGPTATFANAVASTNVTTASMAASARSFSGTASGPMQGNARLQRVVGGVETTLATTTFTLTPPAGDDPAETTFNPFPALSPSTDSATGQISYRMDLQRVSGATSATVTATTSVTRN